MPRARATPEEVRDLKFPRAGMHIASGFGMQPVLKTPDGYAHTTILGTNVQTYEALTERGRGGSRPMLAKYATDQVPGGASLIQELQVVTYTAQFVSPTVTSIVRQQATVFRQATAIPGETEFGASDPLLGPNREAVTGTFGAGVIAGSLLIVIAGSEYANGLPTIVNDSFGSVFVELTATNLGSIGPQRMWYGFAKSSGPNIITLTGRVAYHRCTVGLLEYSGVKPFEPYDGYAASNSVPLASLTTGTITVSESGELLIGSFSFGVDYFFIPADQSFTPGSGFTTVISSPSQSAPTYPKYEPLWVVEKLNVSANAAATGSLTDAGWGASTGNAIGAAFKSWGATMQTNVMGRVNLLVSVQLGFVYTVQAGDVVWAWVDNMTGSTWSASAALSTTEIVRSAQNGEYLYFADGTNWVKHYFPGNVLEAWTATAGSRPVDHNGNAPRLICTWRGRTVVSGLKLDSQNVFMSAVGDPTDWDYSPASITPTQAVAFNASPLGLVGDMVTSLCPYSDDTLIIFGDHTIWLCQGDPMAGGTLQRVSDAIGGTWGICWCKDPSGVVYFMSNRMALYRMVPGQTPVQLSQPIQPLLNALSIGTQTIRLFWDDRFQGVRIFITSVSASAAQTHYFFEARCGAWWKVVFANNSHNPNCGVVFDGNLPGDRRVLIGSWDGYVRAFSTSATTDDGTNCASEIWITLPGTPLEDDIYIHDLQATLGTTSGSITATLHSGATFEQAYAATGKALGTWSANKNNVSPGNQSGHGHYVKITATVPWAMEKIILRMQVMGDVARRGNY
jgi:hypothetical protein